MRFAPGSSFPFHEHGAGEEFLVLEGTLCDEDGVYPAGTYVRNPPGSAHSPCTEEGCVLFVKLRQFAEGDDARVVIDTKSADWRPHDMPGVDILPLHTFGNERVMLVRFAPTTRYRFHDHPGGEEIFVLDGVLTDDGGVYEKGTWLRNPPGSAHKPFSYEGCTLYLKTGHLG